MMARQTYIFKGFFMANNRVFMVNHIFLGGVNSNIF